MSGAALELVGRPTAEFRPEPGSRTVVLDTGWIPDPDVGDVLPVLPTLVEVMGAHDVFDEAMTALDGWARESGLVEVLEVETVSFWYHRRIGYWWRLAELLVWLPVIDALVTERRPTSLSADAGVPPLARLAASLVGRREGIPFTERLPSTGGSTVDLDGTDSHAPNLIDRLRDRRRRFVLGRRSAGMGDRLDGLVAEGAGRLLVLTEHARQRVDTADGPRFMNPYLDPVIDRLRGGPLEPIILALDASVSDEEQFAELRGADASRRLPGDILLTRFGRKTDLTTGAATAHAIAERIATSNVRLEARGIDLGPSMREEVVRTTRSALPARLRDLARARRLLAALRPAGVLLANEYGRPEWLAAARLERIPVAAVQHGVIHPWHPGYIHPDRPASLPLPDRTYVFGDWERRLLINRSVYRDGEVIAAGSPRIDLVAEDQPRADRARVRAELGIPADARLVVVSTTFHAFAQLAYTIPALGAIFDRELPGVHIVLKLHPREAPAEPYSAFVRERARAAGFTAPPTTVVQRYDLYRLLAAADAHLGIHSTVITEAVVTGTPNVLMVSQASADLLGYIEAAVALPIRNGGDLLAALDAAAAGAISAAARRAFIEDHFRPGVAAERIRDDLVAWLTSR